MQNQNTFLATAPFDLYELHLFRLVADERNFTRAARKASLTQSAMTRQIAGMETALGVSLFERTTRSVSLTDAGKLLYERAARILSEVSSTLEDLQHDFGLGPKLVSVGVSRSIAFSYLPGFLFKFQRDQPHVQVNLAQESSARLLEMVDERALDVAIVSSSARIPRGLEIVHRFRDDFTVITPAKDPIQANRVKPKGLVKLLHGRRWLLLRRDSVTGRQLHRWLESHSCQVEPAMEVDNFDLIVNMVSLGLGVSIVPHRSLPLYLQRRTIRRISLRPGFSREIVVVTRKSKTPRAHVQEFVKSILY